MAKNEGSEGAGKSTPIAPVESPNATRRAVKARRNRASSRSNVTMELSVTTVIEDKRIAWIQAAEAHLRRQQRPSFKSRFRDAFGKRVAYEANSSNWSPQTRQLAHSYLTALLSGDGKVPTGLRGRPVSRVRWHFAMTCAKMRVHPNSFPGQAEEWFMPLLKSAQDVVSRKQTKQAGNVPNESVATPARIDPTPLADEATQYLRDRALMRKATTV